MADKAKIKDSDALCNHCQTQMVVLKIKKYPGLWSWSLISLGLISFFFIHLGGPVIGIPMFLLGIYMATANQLLSMCPKCGYYYDVLVATDPV